MDRITFEGNFCDIAMCRESPCPYNGMCSQRETWERLKKYEDAEQDGRLVVLPCKVGDTVYRVLTTRDCPPVISEVKIKTVGQAADLIGRMGKRKLLSYYLTREEAEAALNGKGGEG